MGMATLGGITFRINPNEIAWNWNILTSVQETIGGRVVQIYGATLSDIVVTGSFGEARIAGQGGENSPGRGWQQAETFAKQIHDLMVASSPPPGGRSAYVPSKPVRFTYFTAGDHGHGNHDYDFLVYVRSLRDANGNAVVEHRTGKFAYGYTLTLVPVVDNTTKLMNSLGPVRQSKQAAIEAALSRISDGIGWKLTRYNDAHLADDNKDGLGAANRVDYVSDLRAAILKQGGITGITPPGGATASSGSSGSSGSNSSGGAPVISKGSVSAPLSGDNVLYSQAFGWPSGHPGIDLAQPLDSPMFAVADGVVADSGPASGFGNWIVINHPKLKVTSVYGHLYDNQLLVRTGDNVKAGQQIGRVGSNGQSTGPHLHLEVWQGTDGVSNGGNKIDPDAWLRNQGVILPALGSSGAIKVQS